MKTFFALMFISFSALAQNSSPKLDPNKYTICAITINSDDEKKVFQAQAAKHSSKFNPVVELTDFNGGKDWFKKSCESGIKCDQLVISGHFGGDFFSEDGTKELKTREIEEASCNKSCEGILKNPLEVFLFGCNTLSNKDEDSRTPAQYLQVLLNDNIPLARAEMVVESRYGNVGDSHRGTMQRIFSGDKKQIYGFDSIGPSGKNVKGFLNNYFAQVSAPKRLELIESQRLMEKVDFTNKILASNLKNTAFTQCPSVAGDDQVTKDLCALQDNKLSREKRLDLIHSLLGQENYLSYLPAINNFFKENDAKNFNEAEKKELALIAENSVIKGQIKGLIDTTKSVGLKHEWLTFASNVGFITPEEHRASLKGAIKTLFDKKMDEDQANILCNLNYADVSKIGFTLSDFKNKNFGPSDIQALDCLEVRDPGIVKQVEAQAGVLKQPWDKIGLMRFMLNQPDVSSVSPKTLATMKNLLQNPDEEIYSEAVQFFAKFGAHEPIFKQRLGTLMSSKNPDAQQTAIYAYTSMTDKDPKITSQIANIAKTSKDQYTAATAISYLLTVDKEIKPETVNLFKEIVKNPNLDENQRESLKSIIQAFR